MHGFERRSTKTDGERLTDGTEVGSSEGPRDGEWLNDGTVVGTIEGYEDGE